MDTSYFYYAFPKVSAFFDGYLELKGVFWLFLMQFYLLVDEMQNITAHYFMLHLNNLSCFDICIPVSADSIAMVGFLNSANGFWNLGWFSWMKVQELNFFSHQ